MQSRVESLFKEASNMKKDMAFSGLEAAIVLIAFVVVAAVFSYVMLGAGFFATQKSQEVTYSGVKQSTSNLVLDGQLYGEMDTSSPKRLSNIKFTLAVPQGGQPQDLDLVDYTVTVQGTKFQQVASGPTAKQFAVSFTKPTSDVDDDGILKADGKASMTLSFQAADTARPAAGDSFTIEVRPSVGAATLITKKLGTGYSGGYII